MVTEFEWYPMAEASPEDERGPYLVMGVKGGIYLAPRYEGCRDKSWFRDTRGKHIYTDSVLAWAEIPPLDGEELHRANA